MNPTPVEVARRFVDAINAHDLAALAECMTDDHRFTDSLGAVVVGRALVCDAWEQYFAMMPDYRVEIHEAYGDGPVVVLTGRAEGTYSPNGQIQPEGHWSIPAAWRARIAEGQVSEWQVYADNEPVRERIRSRSA